MHCPLMDIANQAKTSIAIFTAAVLWCIFDGHLASIAKTESERGARGPMLLSPIASLALGIAVYVLHIYVRVRGACTYVGLVRGNVAAPDCSR